MKGSFNQQVCGVTPEQTRLALSGKTMIEQEQPIPVLKPDMSIAQASDEQAYKQKLKNERDRVYRYQMKVTEIHTTLRMNGKVISSHTERQVQPINRTRQLTNDFNQGSAQAFDRQQLEHTY